MTKPISVERELEQIAAQIREKQPKVYAVDAAEYDRRLAVYGERYMPTGYFAYDGEGGL